MTHYRTLLAKDLGTEQWSAWSSIQDSAPGQSSPFFNPEFTKAVSEILPNVEVTVMEVAGKPVGFFPFQRKGRSAEPIVGRLSEFHGAILTPNADWSPKELCRAAKLGYWHFDHLPDSQVDLRQFAWGSKPSPFVDLKQGYGAYRDSLKSAGSSLAQVERKARKMTREVGPLRFEWHDTNPHAFQSLITWKWAQHSRSGVLQIFKHAWVSEILTALMETRTATFSAPCGTLYAGDELVAVHLGICNRNVMHLWFPAYNSEYEKYSPGLILLLNLAEAAAERGVSRIDLGPGEERYKQNFKSGDLDVYEGMLTNIPILSSARELWYHTKRSIRGSRYREQLEAPLLATRRLRQWLAFRR